MTYRMWVAIACLSAVACGSAEPANGPAAPADEEPFEVIDPDEAKRDAALVLDAWHAAAAAADEEAYFAHFADEGVFLGTDATERWDRDAFRTYAHPHFERGRAWSFTSTRREIEVRGDIVWFDEDLATGALGPARGSGVLVRDGEVWKIAQYNLALTIPNESFAAVREALMAAPEETSDSPESTQGE